MLSLFPHLTEQEFEGACEQLVRRYEGRLHEPSEWAGAELLREQDTPYLKVSRAFSSTVDDLTAKRNEDSMEELHEDDEEELLHVAQPVPVVSYDIVFSAIYRVPVLYIHISDALHRYPTTMNTLYNYLIPPQFKAQTESAGIIGGISVADHPVTNRPVFFIHPCQTAQVMEASLAGQAVSAYEYLLVWIGALGKCVGLNVPMSMVHDHVAT